MPDFWLASACVVTYPGPVCDIAGQDSLVVCLATIENNLLVPAMLLQRLTQEPLGRGQIVALTEPELHRTAVVVNSAVEIPATSLRP